MEVWGAGGVAMGLNGARRAVLSHRAHHLTAVLPIMRIILLLTTYHYLLRY